VKNLDARRNRCRLEGKRTYDNNNQPSMISVPGQGSITYNEYKWNMPEAITLPGGIKNENTFTPLMQPKYITLRDLAHNPLMNHNYEYSTAGNVKTKKTENGNYAYQYDELYRLIGSTNASNETYTYDAVGNRLTSNIGSQPSADSYTYNANNELTELRAPNSELRTFEYDFNGNMIRKIDQNGTTTFTYDIDNRLIQIRNPQSTIIITIPSADVFGRTLTGPELIFSTRMRG
jgi:YD repeat-containing protein